MVESAQRFSFYASFYEAAKDLDDEKRLAFYDAIMAYAFDGIEPEFTGIMNAVWNLTKPNVDASIKYCKAGAKGGKKGASNPPSNPSKSKAETPLPTEKEKEKDGEKEKDVDKTFSSRKKSYPRNRSVGAAVAEATPPDDSGATSPHCPECGELLSFSVSKTAFCCSEHGTIERGSEVWK